MDKRNIRQMTALLKVEVGGVAEEGTSASTIVSGVSTTVLDLAANLGEVRSKHCKITAKLVKVGQ